MNAGKWPSPDADSATFIRFLKRRLQCLEDRSMSADPGDLLVAYNHGRIESLRGAIKALETEDSDASPEEDKQTSAPTPATVAPVVLIDGGVFASFNYDNRLQVSARGVPALAENILCHLVSPDRLQEAIGDFEEGYRLMLKRHGIGNARRWYWGQVMKVAVRGLFNAVCKAAKIWGGFGPA